MKDYSNYFKGPSLNEAKRRSRDEVGRYDDAIMFQEIWSKLD